MEIQRVEIERMVEMLEVGLEASRSAARSIVPRFVFLIPSRARNSALRIPFSIAIVVIGA